MQLRSVVIVAASFAASAAAIPANPVVKHLPARAINFDGSFGGLVFKRQSGCPEGYNACGTGCSAGPCCNADSGLACRPNEVCTEVNGNTGCCPTGFTCNSIIGCQNAVGTGCTPGSVTNGLLCCDAAAPVCGTNNGVPYCAGAVPDIVYTINPSGVYDSTSTTSVTATETLIITPTSDAVSTTESTDTESVTTTDTASVTTTDTASVTTIDTASITTTDTASVTTTETELITSTETASITSSISESNVFTIQTSLPTLSIEPTSTFTSTIVVYPTGNGTGNATATISPPEITGAASKFGVSGFALTILMGLAFVL